MLSRDDLQAIAQMMDQKLDQQEKRIIVQVDQKLEQQEKRIIDQVDRKLEQQEHRIMNQVNAIIETKVTPQIRLIAEQHGDIIARLPEIEEQAEIKSRVQVLERVFIDLRKEVDQIKKAN